MDEGSAIVREVEPGLSPTWLPVGRLSALTDAFFAIVMTLSVLTIDIPKVPKDQVDQELVSAIWDLWPQVLVYVLSFAVLGFQWVGHHAIYRYVRRVDRKMIWMNFIYLLAIAMLPFSTGLIGDYIDHRLPIIIYAINMLVIRVFIELQWWYVTRDDRLVDERPDREYARLVNIHMLIGSIGFVLVIAAAIFNPTLALVVLFFALIDGGLNAAWIDRLRVRKIAQIGIRAGSNSRI